MRARQVFKVSSSTPAAIRLVLELGWFLELGSATAPPDDLGLETAAPSDVDDPLLDDPLDDPPDLLELPEDRESDEPAREPLELSPAVELSGRVRVYPWPFTILPCGTSSFSCLGRLVTLMGES